MGARVIESRRKRRGRNKDVIDHHMLFRGVLNDPKLSRHLLLAPHIAEGKNGNNLSFIGYLKKLIMSREISEQLAAVKGILSALIGCPRRNKSHSLKEEKFIMAKLLDNDFVEFMCEALPSPAAPSADELIQAIFGCLALLCGEQEFYIRFHAVYALEAVLRNLHFVCEALSAVKKSSLKELHTLSIGLALIAMILEGSVNKSSVLEEGRKTVEGGSILERIFQLIRKSLNFENPSIKWKSGLVVRGLLNVWHLGKCFSLHAEKIQGSLCKHKKYSPSHLSKSEKIKEVKEICRKMSFYHRGVQMIQTSSTLQQSSICVENDEEDQDVSSPPDSKEITLVKQLIEMTLSELVKFIDDLLKAKVTVDKKLMNQFLLLICQVGKNSLRLLPHNFDLSVRKDVACEKNEVQELSHSEGSPLEAIFNAVAQSIGGLCATHLVEIEFNKNSLKVFKECLSCLELLYQKAKNFCSPLSHKLAAKGYLNMLPYLLTVDDHFLSEYTTSKDDLCMMKSTCQVVLTHLLATLAETELSWSDSFSVLSKGLSSLPKKISIWPTIISSHACQPAGATMIVFSYFYFLCSSRPDVSVPFLKPLVCFVEDVVKVYGVGTHGGDIPAPILKALWFSFATSYLSNECPKDPKIEGATHAIMNCIRDYNHKHLKDGIKDIFTYHPALLLWVFSSPVKNQWIQLRVVMLWFEGCQSSKSSKEVEQLMAHNQDAFICLLSIAENGQQEAMECALRTVWSFLQDVDETKRKEISLSLWEILIYVLTRFTAIENPLEKERRALNVSCMVQLVQGTFLSEPNPSTVLRLACLLNRILSYWDTGQPHSKNFGLLYFSGLQMLQFLLDISLENEDTRVASAMLSHSGQVKRLEWAANLCAKSKCNQKGIALQYQENASSASNFLEDLNSLAYSILASLLCVDPYSQSTAEQISVNAWHFLKATSSSHNDLSISSLKLLNTILQIHVKQSSFSAGPFIQITDAGRNALANAAFIRMLYLQLIMLCARASPEMRKYCWKSLCLALQLPDKNFASHLSRLPWNIALIQSQLAIINGDQSASIQNSHDAGPIELSEPFLCFLDRWLTSQHQQGIFIGKNDWEHCGRSFMKIKSRSVGYLMFQKVLNAVAKAITCGKCDAALSEDCWKTSRGKAVIHLMVLLTKYEKYLPSDVRHTLKKKVATVSKQLQKNDVIKSKQNTGT
ncbi:uncharacterized protein LOC124161554 [Ischnura elegans]|uniref:uncharacterized protein LOC124161554 n=1 Tax=Ischnura elegans TaxID=197161 RepID=UPI001ED88925|nr:uncharacterized protein LOC124161554 [Ischnura elegans]